ncbi:MAG TPA: tRNA pseudouridine(38-40) synthase TruA [Gemmatimonadota bacterium]|nr:tRNA pseudouridine(38-40) synthase TruA [Gemmatimonadota bacterium]
MSNRVRGVLQYDGTRYRGWQRQPDAPTVQEMCERALGRVLGQAVAVVAAGRTDSGVHARGQVVHLDPPCRMPLDELRRAWNAHLPADIWVQALEPAPGDFHARHSAVRRTYRYYVAEGPGSGSPFVRRYAWAQRQPLDWTGVEAVSRGFLGPHDFRRFAKGDGESPPSPRRGVCTILALRWDPTAEGRVLEITADRFLRHMVRAIVAALVAVGRGRIAPEAIGAALEPGGRRVTTGAAPPNGLFLWKVDYDR